MSQKIPNRLEFSLMIHDLMSTKLNVYPTMTKFEQMYISNMYKYIGLFAFNKVGGYQKVVVMIIHKRYIKNGS